MAKPPVTIRLALDERLRESRRQGTSLSLPLAVHYRLDLLADLATDVKASRAEIIGMLIAAADLDDPGTLERGIVAYRKMLVGDVVPKRLGEARDEADDDNVVALPVRQPGRPSNRASE
jgi:hypothetical protein